VRAQFLCYKQLKKFLKQLPDTSVGARSLRAPRRPQPVIRLGQYASGLGRRVLAYLPPARRERAFLRLTRVSRPL
jgi:hypothetical protein